MGAQDEHRHPRLAVAHPAQHLAAVEIGQAEIEDDEVVALGAERGVGVLAARHELDGVALAAERGGDVVAQGRVVLDDEQAHG